MQQQLPTPQVQPTQDAPKGVVAVARLVEAATIALPETLISEVKTLFPADDPLGSVVVADQGRPVGLVMSLHLDRALSHRFGSSIYMGKPVSGIMDDSPLIVDALTPIEKAAHKAMTREKSRIFDHVIVVRDGLLLGIAPVRAILEALAVLQHRRGVQMQKINADLKRQYEERLKAEAAAQQAKKDLERANEQLKVAFDKLRDVDKMKTDFLSTVSHELRTPLTSVLGFADMIQQKTEGVIFPLIPEDAGPKVKKAMQQVSRNLGVILRESERLTHLINDVLDIAKMEAGKIEWKKEVVDPAQVVRNAAEAVSALFEKKGLALHNTLPESMPPILGDPHRLEQVVINLLSNAVKFTDAGGVKVFGRVENGGVVIGVADNGVGIAKDDLEKVFIKFKQVGDTLTDKPTGTGLGLPICKQIIEHHGGRIWAESEFGRGATFSFALPSMAESEVGGESLDPVAVARRIREHAAQKRRAAADNPRLTVLVVDDDEAIAELLGQTLAEAGHLPLRASNGRQAVESTKNERPDIVVMDVHMPDMNGYDAAAVLKNDPDTAQIPIIMHTVDGSKERGERIGVERFLVKPVKKEDLLQAINEVAGPADRNVRVLVADDSLDAVKRLGKGLVDQGLTVLEAVGREECLERAQHAKPDAAVLFAAFAAEHNIKAALTFGKGLTDLDCVILADGAV